MKTILYVEQNQVQMVEITKTEKKYRAVPLQAGGVLNGVILDASKVQTALEDLNIQKKKVTLVIGSNNLLSKKLTLPKVSKAKLRQIVKGEFDLLHSDQNYQYDTNILSATAPLTVMGYAVNQDIIDAYLQVCKNCGLAVERVEFLLNGLINYIKKTPKFQGKTFLFNVVYGEHLLSLLFEDGRYKMSNRIRLLNVGKGELFYQELYGRLSTMIQFSNSERSAHAIDDSYYIGISPEEMSQLAQYVGGSLQVQVHGYQDDAWDMDYFLPALATYKNKQDINFAMKHQEIARRGEKRQAVAWKAAVLLVILGAVAAHSFAILRNYDATCKAYEELAAASTDPVTLGKLEEYTALVKENGQLKEEISQYNQLFSLLDSGAVVEKPVLEEIFQDGAIENFSFDFITGAVRIQGMFPTIQEATDYAARLRGAGFFVTMDYSGYNLEDYGQTDEPMYHFSITAAYEPIEEVWAEEVASK